MIQYKYTYLEQLLYLNLILQHEYYKILLRRFGRN
jgi:hypothetical protein